MMQHFTSLLLLLTTSFLLLPQYWSDIISGSGTMAWATSINYGISQQPITDINQLMPKLCQNQSVICEGSFCIPGVRKCVCDLRMPVQYGRYCLRQVDIETKCFVTSQCNHTVKDAVCIDISSNAILDSESSKFRLDQWQQLNELRQLSSKSGKDQATSTPSPERQIEPSSKMKFVIDTYNFDNTGYNFESRDVITANARNSPYEINYDTRELLAQNHTRRRTNHSEANHQLMTPTSIPSTTTTTTTSTTTTTTTTTTAKPSIEITTRNIESSTQNDGPSTTSTGQYQSETTTITSSGEVSNRKKAVIKNLSWPPGMCSCPHGFMFDSMLRKCLALSLADSHCQVDSDCKQILMAHCSLETKKCRCDEPLVWNQAELACVRPKPPVKVVETPSVANPTNGSFLDNLLPPLILAKLLPDHTILFLIFVFLVILGTLIILKLTVKCFSSSSSALISPKTKKKKPNSSNQVPPKSPYATLRRPDHKPASQLSNFTQATRGRILNYDFEQEGELKPEYNAQTLPPSQTKMGGNPKQNKSSMLAKGGTLKMNSKSHNKASSYDPSGGRPHSSSDMIQLGHETDEVQPIDLNDNVSISQLESESKSDNSVLAMPAPPPPNQQPPYMLASAMKGQGSAIAAAAAAVANKRMHKKNMEQQNSGKVPDVAHL